MPVSEHQRVREGRIVERRQIEALKPGDLVQHYSTWEQTYGDPIRREVVKVEHGPDVREHDLVVTWRDPAGEHEGYQTREKPSTKVDVIVGTPDPAELAERDLSQRILALEEELAKAYSTRAGMLRSREPGRETGWCVSCGRNVVACCDGYDTCSECLP